MSGFTCSECGNNTAFTWDHTLTGSDGSLGPYPLHSVTAWVYLGCDVCSATIVTLRLGDVLAAMSEGWTFDFAVRALHAGAMR